MQLSSSIRRVLLTSASAWPPARLMPQAPQAPAKPFEPSVGQAGKDVVWVPTPQALVDKMLDMAKVTPQDYLIDLGSGDGRTVITAAKRGVRALGIEYNPDMVELSKRNAAAAGVSDKASFVKADIFESDFSKATVITMFLLPDAQPAAATEDAGPRARHEDRLELVHDGSVGAGRNRDGHRRTAPSWCTALFWIVPAKVEGPGGCRREISP